MKTKSPQILWNNPHLNIPSVYKFDMSLNKAFNEYMTPFLKDKKEEFVDVYMNRMLGRNGQAVVDNASTPEGRFLAEISVGAFEIFNTYESMLDTEIYIRKFPYSGTRISKSRYLKNVFGNYLNTVYMLTQRMERYLNLLRKRYGKASLAGGKLTLEITEILKRYTKESFEYLNSIRGIHVHVEEFYDEELEQLSILENFINNSSSMRLLDRYKDYYYFQFDRIRKKKIKEIKKINADAEEVLDNFFDLIYTIVFDDTGNLIVRALPAQKNIERRRNEKRKN